jgi:hypothetical protein
MAADLPAGSPRESGPTPPTEQCRDTDTDTNTHTDVDAYELLGHANDAPAGPISPQRRRIRAALPVAMVLCIV